MTRSKFSFGTVAALALGAVLVAAGDSSIAVACDSATKTASATESCCAKEKSASAAMESKKIKHTRLSTASVEAGTCVKGAGAMASGACAKSTAVAASGSGCESATTASYGGEKAATMAAGGGACCESKSAKTAAMSGGCDETAKSASIKTAVDNLPYGENKRVIIAGTYACGHCALEMTDECAPMLKTADGKVYPMLNNARVEALRAAKASNGVEVSGLVRKVDGVKYIDVKSYRAL